MSLNQGQFLPLEFKKDADLLPNGQRGLGGCQTVFCSREMAGLPLRLIINLHVYTMRREQTSECLAIDMA